jgi:hypothetical protein
MGRLFCPLISHNLCKYNKFLLLLVSILTKASFFFQDASSSALMQVDPKETSIVVRDEMQNGRLPQAQTILYNSKVLK